MSDETEILDLIDQADKRQFERDINKLERILDAGDRFVAQQVTMMAAKAEANQQPDPTTGAAP